MFAKFLPKQPAFFDEFDRHADVTVEGARCLLALMEDYTDLLGKVTRIKEIEHAGDSITHRTIELLHTSFITPIDRDQIHQIISGLDDILDAIEAAALEFHVYEIVAPRPEAKELARLLVAATEQVRSAVRALRDLKRPAIILKHCVEIRSIENQGDTVHLQALARLFKESKDPLEVMKWKEILENLETGIDRCQDVANAIEGVVLENA